MTQALFTSMTGINAGTDQLTVVSDNVANMNTTAYKTSRVDFQDIWYQTSTTGTNSTTVMGGTNPYQIGVGVQCSAITKNMSASSVNTTGLNTDMAIQGNGWFTVVNADGAVLYTRDGSFSLDEEGYLVTANGYKVLGMDEMTSLTASTTPIKVPTSIKVIEEATPADDLSSMVIDDLNGVQLTGGTFYVTATLSDGSTVDITVTLEDDISDTTVAGVVNQINSSTFTDADGNTCNVSDYLTAVVVDGAIQFQLAGDSEYLTFQSGGTSNFVAATNIASVSQADDGSYTTDLLNKSATITEVDDITADETKLYSSFSVGSDGLLTVTYSDGSTLSVLANEDGTTYFCYTDAEGYVICDDIENSGDASLYVDPNVLVKANMQLQIAVVTNDSGMVAVGDNLYQTGVNSGQVVYTAANINGAGSVVTGALETSNVDLAEQFANMILAQRLVQANSQVFSSANDMLETIVYLGQ